MPAPSTVSDFLDVCRKSGVIDESCLSTIQGPASASPVAAAKALVRAGKLTKFQAGQLLAGKYRGLRFDRLKILDKIGSGGMGTVFLCEHLGLRKKVAVKVLPPDQAGDEGVRERFFREARAAASLDHPNIVRVHDMNSSGGVHYIVMEYVEGQDLQSILNKYGAMPYGRACNYIAQAALGLQHAHEKGLVHRDIKPANLLVDKEGVVKILDLGLATFSSESEEKDNLTARFDKGAVLGTADYMAPEQIIASSNVDIRADIYSLGVTLYALINGKPPFGGTSTQKLVGHTSITATSLTTIRREVPKGLSAIVDKMMAKDPAQRLQTPAEVVDALNPWLEADTIPLDGQQTRKMPGVAKSGRRKGLKKKSRMPLIVTAIAISALVFGGLGAWALTGNEKADKASAATNVGNQKAQPATTTPKANPVASTPATPINRNEARLVYEIDFAKAAAFTAKYSNKNRVSMEGSYPPGWATLSWRGGAVADISIQDHMGSRGVALRTTQGEGGSAELHTAMGASPYSFTPGKRYLLRTEYANIGTKTASFEVRFDAERPPVKNSIQLKPTRGEWQTIDLTLIAPQHERVTTYFTNSAAVYPNYLVVRSVQVFEFGSSTPATTGPARLVFEEDFGKAPSFHGTTAKPGGLTMQQGSLPDGWTSFVWRDGARGEVAQEEFAGKKGIAFRTIEGENCAEVTTTGQKPKATIKAGHTYRVDVEYAAPGDPGGRFDIRFDDMSKPGADQARFTRTGNSWKTATARFTCPDDKDRPFSIYLVNYGVGTAETVFVHTVKLFDLTADPNVPAAGAAGGSSIYRLAAAEWKPFRVALSQGRHVSSADVPELPNGVLAGMWRQEDTGEVAVEDIAGRRGMTLANGDGGVSIQVFPGEPVAELKAGQEYVIKVVHLGGSSAGGRIQLRKPQSSDSIVNHALGGTDGKWAETTARMTATESGPVHLFLQNGTGGTDGRVTIHSVEIFAAGKEAAPVAVTGYRLNLTNAKSLAKRYRKDVEIESQGDGTLPAPWAGHTLSADTVGDVFVDPVAGTPALGLRNDDGAPSVELFCKSALCEAKAGKKYSVRVAYQTETNGKGGVQIALGGQECGRTDFTTSVGTWKDVELTITANVDGPLTMTITCGSVGSESSVFIKEIEIKESP
ncbi:MAG TPA: serine/threonine-protein kinase [Gemmataceae bacterium]|jgi:serine/threonine protein kinase|nr:serine/threonine-protein kinase [Gemmataceae bacterium]